MMNREFHEDNIPTATFNEEIKIKMITIYFIIFE